MERVEVITSVEAPAAQFGRRNAVGLCREHMHQGFSSGWSSVSTGRPNIAAALPFWLGICDIVVPSLCHAEGMDSGSGIVCPVAQPRKVLKCSLNSLAAMTAIVHRHCHTRVLVGECSVAASDIHLECRAGVGWPGTVRYSTGASGASRARPSRNANSARSLPPV